MTKLQLAKFNKRSYTVYRHQRTRLNAAVLGKDFEKRAKRVELPFSLGAFRIEMDEAIGKPCPYCSDRMTLSKIGLDHRIPVTRACEFKATLQTMTDADVSMLLDNEVKELTFLFSNLEFICQKCNKRKGDLTNVEFKQLVEFVSLLPTAASKYIMTKLGSRVPFFNKSKADAAYAAAKKAITSEDLKGASA